MITEFNNCFIIRSPSLFSYLITSWQLHEAICHFSSQERGSNYAWAEYYLQQNTFKRYYARADHYLLAVICRPCGGLSANGKEENNASNDNSVLKKRHRGYYMVARRYEFYVEWQEQYLTSDRSELVRYCSCHENIPSRFLRRFPKIFQSCSEGQTNVFREFPKNYEDVRRFPKIAKDLRGRDLKMFRWYTNEVKYNLRDKLEREKWSLSSHVRISYGFYQFVTTRYSTDFYIIKVTNIFQNFDWLNSH